MNKTVLAVRGGNGFFLSSKTQNCLITNRGKHFTIIRLKKNVSLPTIWEFYIIFCF